tara:strand:- start:48 stop:593 length:546 start_codon:yes stop_codon:yes gene_type:complete
MAKENNSRMGTILVILVLLGLGVLLYFLYNQNIKHNMEEEYLEKFENDTTEEEMEDSVESFSNQNLEPNKMDHLNMDANVQEKRAESCFPKEQLGADDLLPKDDSSLWAQSNPSGEGSLKDRNFLQSGYHIGINTVGQTLRNANQQLRSEPPNPQVKVSPWLQTTIEPDLGRKPMEIGGCA